MVGRVHGFWRRLIARVAVTSLVCQAVMAAYMLPMPMMGSQAQAASLFSGAVAVCSSVGFQQIVFDQDGNPAGTKGSGSQCPVCEALAVAAFALQNSQPAVLAAMSSPIVLWPANDFQPGSVACLSHNNRDPPTRA